MWSSLRFVFFQLTILTIIISVNGLSLHHHAKKNQVLPVPPITVVDGPVPPPNPFPFPTLPGQSFLPSPTSPPTIHPQCDIICPYDPKCQKMPFQPPPNGQSYCACACQVCNGQYYGPTNNYQNAQPLKALQIQNCPNFVYGNA